MRPIVSVPEEDRATDTGNINKKIGKDRACGSGDILADRQTHRQTYSSQYFSTAPASVVINRPHRSIRTNRIAWSVCLSVCLSVTIVSPAKTAQLLETPFGMWTRVGQ